MGKSALYERDLLYSAGNITELGSVHIELMNPGKDGKLPVIIEKKSSHSPVEYIGKILDLLQADTFDRVNIDIKTNVRVYIKTFGHIKKENEGMKYLAVTIEGDEYKITPTDKID